MLPVPPIKNMKTRHYNIPIFVPHIGCTHMCSFCNQKRITGSEQDITAAKVKEMIERHLTTIPKESDVQVAFFGGSFTSIDVAMQTELLEAARPYLHSGRAQGIRISTRPDDINRENLAYLKAYGVKAIELGVQSMNEEVLLQNKRGHTASHVRHASGLIKEFEFELGLQMMTGLLGSNEKIDAKTGEEIADLCPDTVRIYPTVVLKNTELHDKYRMGSYIPPTLDKTIAQCKQLCQLFESRGIKVIRMGLQATEMINEKDIVAGPYHSAFGELVRSSLLLSKAERLLLNADGPKAVIFVNPYEVSRMVGNKKANIVALEIKTGKRIFVKAREDVSPGQIAIDILPLHSTNEHKIL